MALRLPGLKDDFKLLVPIALVMSFLRINFTPPDLGDIYFGMALLWGFTLLIGFSYEFFKSSRFSQLDFILPLGILAAWYMVANYTLTGGLTAYSTLAAIPIADVFAVVFLTFVFFIPVLENAVIIGVPLKILLDSPLGKTNKYLAYAGTGLIFALFHVAVRGLTTAVLPTDFIFGAATAYVIHRQNELKGATLAHMAANAGVLLTKGGI